MAGLINWKKISPPASNPDTAHLYVGVDPLDCKLYIKDDTGTVFKYLTNGDLAAELANYDLSTTVDSKILTAINNLIDGAGTALDTLNELADALGNDPNFATTITNALALKANTADLGDLALLDTVNTTEIEDGAVTNAKIGTNAITAVKINNNSVLNSKASDMPSQTIKGNDTGVTGDPKDLTVLETKTMLALENVDNTSDANKPVSTAQATAIASAVTAHEAAPDPHPQYLTSTEGNAAYQPLDGDLTAVAALAGAGFAVRTTTNTWATRSLTTPGGSGLAITNQDGVFGSPSFTNTDKGSDAVASHVAASDPHPNYETTTELNARDTANRSRSNHTGTQTASTISDFASTVIATLLTGYTVGAASALSATDSILVAFGKIQAMINSVTAAIATKYDASNPSGYQTAAQVTTTVNNASTADRARANHTGTQTSSTISDFATTTLNTVLTGLSTATNAVITAGDTVLSALGKLQKQLSDAVNDVNATFAVVNGRLDTLEATDAEWIELIKTSADQLTTSNTTLTNVTDLQFAVTSGNTYYIELTLLFRTQATTTGIAVTMGSPNGAAGYMWAQVNIPIAADGTAALFTGNITSLGDVVTSTGVQTSASNFVLTLRGVFICTTGGNIVPQFRSEVSGSNAAVAIGSVVLVRVF